MLVFGAILFDLVIVLFGSVIALLPIYAVDILETEADGLGLLRAKPAVGSAGRIDVGRMSRCVTWTEALLGDDNILLNHPLFAVSEALCCCVALGYTALSIWSA